MARIGWWIANGLVGLLLLCAFLLPSIAGTWATYVSLGLSLILILWTLIWAPRVGYDLGAWFFVISWSLIAIAFMITNQPGTTDYLLAANFIMFALYPLLSATLQRFAHPRNSLVVAVLSLLGTLASFGFAAYEVYGLQLGRAKGYEANPIRYASIALLLGFFSLIGMFVLKDWRRYTFLTGPLLGVATVFLTGSRGPLLTLPALLIVCFVMLPIRRVVTIGVLAALVFGAGGVYALKPSLLGRAAALPAMLIDIVNGTGVSSTTDYSGNIRYTILQGSIIAFEKSPWIGYGWANKTTEVAKYTTWNVGFGPAKYGHLHSDILNFGVSAGVVGLIAYLLVLLAPIASLRDAPRDSQWRGRVFAALVLSISYFFAGAVNLMFGFELMTTLYVICAAVFIGYCRDVPPERTSAA